MRRRILGRTGLEVSELALGGLFVSRLGGDLQQSIATVHRAVELGVNYVDTAPGYADSEEVVGLALAGVHSPLIVSTKLGYRPEPFRPQESTCLMRSMENSLRLLKRDCVDILFIHEPDRPGQFDWWSDPIAYQGPVLDVLDDLRRRGLVRFTGLGGTTAYELVPIMRTGLFDVVLTAFNFSLLWREAGIAILPTARELGMGVVIGSPLQQGALARRYDTAVESGALWLSPPRRAQYLALYAYLDEVGLQIAEAGLRFVISQPDISCVLMGARSPEEVEQNIAAVEKGPLPEEVLRRLDEIADMVPFRPFEEPFGLPFGASRETPYRGPGRAT
jgi:aryl-alcohol dehydrogenase-like predicted oxidoreductase